jgi:hypothetical protein
MSQTIKEAFWDDLKDDIKFFMRNFREIVKRTWLDFLTDMKSD